jgi:hypothetical protein
MRPARSYKRFSYTYTEGLIVSANRLREGVYSGAGQVLGKSHGGRWLTARTLATLSPVGGSARALDLALRCRKAMVKMKQNVTVTAR